MNIAQKNALIRIISIVNARYDGYKTDNARYCLRNLIQRKSLSTKYSEASKDIENLALIEMKKEGYELLHEMIDNIRFMNADMEDSLILLHELSVYDRSKTIEKGLKQFKFDRKATCTIPRQIKFLFGIGTLNCEDIENCEEKIKNFCNITDDFFVKAVRENPQFRNYRTNETDEFNNANDQFNNSNCQFNNANGQFNNANGQFNNANGQFNNANGQFNNANGQFNNANDQFNNNNGQFNNANDQFNNNNGQLNNANGQFNNNNVQFNNGQFNNSNCQFNNANGQFNNNNGQFNNANDQFNNKNGQFNDQFNNQNFSKRTANHILFNSYENGSIVNNGYYRRYYPQCPHPTYQNFPQTKK